MKLVAFFLLFAGCVTHIFAGQSLGFATLSVTGDDQSRPLTLSLWYPGKGGLPENIGGNAVFNGVIAGRDALPAKGKLPVVLVSHGGLRSAANSGAWLSAALARAGYLAIEINAPIPDTAANAVDEIWHRPDDIRRALNTILAEPYWQKHIEDNRISVLGFALGGTAALALAGGEFDTESYVKSCSETDGGPDCAWYQAQNVTLDLVDREKLAESRRDSRIGSVVAIAPEFIDVFSNGLPLVDVPTLLLSLESNNGPHAFATDLVEQAIVPAASIYDGFQVCTAAGPAILSEEGGDPFLCGVSAEARQRVHDLVASKIVTFLVDESRK